MDEELQVRTESDVSDPPATEGGAQRGVVVSRTLAISEAMSGPIPPPAILKGYEELVPGAAERILAQAERQTDHRIQLERLVVESGVRRSWAGLWCGLCVSMTVIVGGCVLVALDHDSAGATIATVGVAALAGVFVYGTSQQRRELREKASQVPPPSEPDQ